MLRMLLFCLAGFGLCLGQTLKPGPCQEFIPKTDFEVPPWEMFWAQAGRATVLMLKAETPTLSTKYLGKWLEIARFATKDQEGQTCNYAEYSDNGDGTVGVHNAGLEANGTYTEIFGYVETTDVPGALILHLDGVPVAGSYNVLETDYVTYTSVYSCLNILGSHSDQAWVLARYPLTAAELDVAISAFTRWGIDVSGFLLTPQEDCSGLP